MEKAAHLIVDVARLDEEGEELAGELAPEALELGPLDQALVVPEGGLHYDLHVQAIDQELLVRGRAWQHVLCTCRRCATRFGMDVSDNTLLVALPLETSSEFVDLTPELREAILLLFPTHPVCRDACQGLCPRCGADLNAGPCSCPPSDAPRWGGLDELKLT